MSVFLDILSDLADGKTLTADRSEQAFDIIMSGKADLAQVAAFAVALRVRGETVPEIVGGARVLRRKAAQVVVPVNAVDTCGTGGDGTGTYNISTAAAFVCAAAGVPVAKHGNKSVSSKSGSADVLAALGAVLDLPIEAHERSLADLGYAFLFAPSHHKAMRHAAPVRASLKLRTIFNLLGPLANPGGLRRQVLGVFDKKWVRPMAEVLQALGSEHVWVVHGADGLDELSLSGDTYVAELRSGGITEFTVNPSDVGLPSAPLSAIKGGNAEENAAALQAVLGGTHSAYRDIVILNAAAALVVGGAADTLKQGAVLAANAVDSGAAKALLERWTAFTQAEAHKREGVESS